MSGETFDIAVVGGGPGGYVAAIRAAQLGQSVALIEKDPFLGGTCLHRGCIPTKALLHYAEVFGELKRCADYGVMVDNVRLDVARMQHKKNDVVNRLARGIDGLIKKNRIRTVAGKGRLVGPGRVEVSGESTTLVEARTVVLATGSLPVMLPGLQADGRRVFTSDEILELDRVPASMLVIGAGAVGLEFASVYRRFGTSVRVVELLPRALPNEDEEISAEIQKALGKQGIEILTSTRVEKVEVEENGVRVRVSTSEGEQLLEAETLLVAVGRRPNTQGLGLEEAGVAMDGPRVRVDDFGRTNLPGVYAVGDLTPGPQLAHMASAEGILAVEHAAGHEVRAIDYDRIPGATYCKPEVASVGLTEREARERGYDVRVGRFPWAALGKAAILGETEGLVKIVGEAKYGELLGVHMIGPHVTDLIAEACLALQCEATVEELFRTVHAHPTLSEAIMEAAHGVFGVPIHSVPPPPRRAPVGAGA
ncbi:MAG: dihydrolipoyl dehydrogenase [Candidatus Eremiobacterota bacterium]